MPSGATHRPRGVETLNRAVTQADQSQPKRIRHTLPSHWRRSHGSRWLLGALLFWAVFFSPSLCVSGIIAHLCEEQHCDEPVSSHESDCVTDPCTDPALRPDTETADIAPLIVDSCPSEYAYPETPAGIHSGPPPDPWSPPHIPMPASDLPLRN